MAPPVLIRATSLWNVSRHAHYFHLSHVDSDHKRLHDRSVCLCIITYILHVQTESKMSQSVSRFQAEVAAVMEVLLKVAVVEITKVFEGRVLDSHGCTVDRDPQIKEDLVRVPDIRAHMESALTNLSDKMVCSVGVQVGETLLSNHQGMFLRKQQPLL